jgi:hypothetical protein
MNNLAVWYATLGRHQDALQFAREALRILQATLPPSHPHVKKAQQFVRHCEVDTPHRL